MVVGRGPPPRVGVLAAQGDVAAHSRALERLGARAHAVRLPRDITGLDALVLPGGESTTIAKALARDGLLEPLRRRIAEGMPVLGTCAGAILLCREIAGTPMRTLAALEATAVRNAYGTQVDSFAAPADEGAAPGLEGLRCVFIRAPKLERLGPRVEVLARVAGEPVLLRQSNVLAATFHPELTEDGRIHAMLVEMTGPRARDVACRRGEEARLAS